MIAHSTKASASTPRALGEGTDLDACASDPAASIAGLLSAVDRDASGASNAVALETARSERAPSPAADDGATSGDRSVASGARTHLEERRAVSPSSWDRAVAAVLLVVALAVIAFANVARADVPDLGASTTLFAVVFAAPALALALLRPGGAATRHVLAASLMLLGGVWTDVTAASAPAQVLALASIAMLAPYRDARVLLTAILFGAVAEFVPLGREHAASGPQAAVWASAALATACAALAFLLVRSGARAATQAREAALARARLEASNAALARELEQRADALVRQAARTAAIAGSSLDAIVTLDPDLVVTDFNPAAERLFGCTRASALGLPLERFVEALGEPGTDVRRRLETAGALAGRRIDALGRVRHGASFPCELVLAPFAIHGARAFVAHVRDVTERARCERASEDASRASESARRARSEFLANMSHEIRTPLNGILGMTALCLDASPSPEQRESLETIRASGESLLAVVDDVLESARLETGKAGLDVVVFALREGVGAEIEMLAPRAHEHGLELVLRIAPDVPDFVRGDPRRLRQVLRNVVGNAIKFTREGEVVVDVRLSEPCLDAPRADGARTPDQADTLLHVTVRDTGIGIPPDRRAEVFDPFVQGDGSSTRRFGGLGLGLSITRRLVELLGGRIWLESEVGAGTTVHCLVGFGAVRMEGATPRSGAARHLAGRTALLVDDHATSREVELGLLRELDLDVQCASSAKEALDLLERAHAAGRPFDVALVDQHMPLIDGIALVGRMQSDPCLSRTSVVLLGSAHQPLEAAEARAHAIDSVVRKPVQRVALRAALERALESRAPASSDALAAARSAVRTRILLAEDHPVNERLAVHLLQKRGFDVTVARNGREALEQHARGAFDVILTDIQMPEQSGLDVAAAVREREKGTGRHVPIVALTAHALSGDRERFLAAGMDDHVTKPIRAGELYAALDRALRCGACAPPSTGAREAGPS